jgi:hypothetical protein
MSREDMRVEFIYREVSALRSCNTFIDTTTRFRLSLKLISTTYAAPA